MLCQRGLTPGCTPLQVPACASLVLHGPEMKSVTLREKAANTGKPNGCSKHLASAASQALGVPPAGANAAANALHHASVSFTLTQICTSGFLMG